LNNQLAAQQSLPERVHIMNKLKDNTTDARIERIRELNDQLRTRRTGGKVVVTSGIRAEGAEFLVGLLRALAAFDDFDKANDPWCEHDCATLIVKGVNVIWKIDYYDPTLTAGSIDPSDPAATLRVLTIMRADEY
jgi:Protein of unknown function (DUF3768)